MWDHLDAIDVIESDHAPHTKAEKDSAEPPFGVPGLETMLPLMLTAAEEGRLTHAQVIEKLHTNPARIVGFVADDTTKVTVDMSEYTIENKNLLTKTGWSPFAGRHVVGKVKSVQLHGTKVFEGGKVLTRPGSGQII